MEIRSVDELLTQTEATIAQPSAQPIEVEPEHIEVDKGEPIERAPIREPDNTPEPEPIAASSDTDDYGNVVEKQEKMIPQSQVESMMRDRLARERERLAKEFQQPQPQQQTQQQFQYDEGNSESWEVQLEQFIEHTLERRDQKMHTQQMHQQEQQRQSDFEVKFNAGAAKYNDFEQVVIGKPLTPQMVLATRGMDDPAAFIYAAAKTQPKELERIAQVSDPYAQAIELGRLEERMRRSRPTTSQAPKPIDPVRGDISDNSKPKRWSIDDKLRQSDRERSSDKMRGRII